MAVHLFPDVSNNEPVIDGLAARQQGMSAIAFKVSEGTSFVDRNAAANAAQATRNGLPRLGYHFMSTADGAAQADHFVKCLAAAGLTGIPVCLDREGGTASQVNAFVVELRRLLPGVPFSAYSASWANARYGQSALLATLPLWWSNYVTGAGSPQSLLAKVTAGYFQPFGGFQSATARQYTNSAEVGGIPLCDMSVCFDDASFARLFAQAPATAPAAHLLAPTETSMISAPPTGGTLVARPDGGVFAYDGANFRGSLPALHVTPAAPIVGIASTRTGLGYWLVGADGGIFAFGDAKSVKGLNQRPALNAGAGKANSPVIGITPAGPSDNWTVTVVVDVAGSKSPELYRLS